MSEQNGKDGIKKFPLLDKLRSRKVKYSLGGTFWPGMLILVILLVLSFIVLGFRLADYANRDNREVLLKSNMDQTLDMFSVTYRNDSGDIIIEGANGEKVIAPGAEVDYSVYLRNKDTMAIDYTLVAQLDMVNTTGNEKLELPIVFRILDDDLNYIAGDAKTWVERDKLDGVSHTGTLLPNESAEYLFQWQWPFDGGDDAYDTMLGSNTKGEIGLNVEFVLRSEANLSAGLGEDFWTHGPGRVVVIFVFFLLLLVAIVLLVISYFKRRQVVTLEEPKPEPIPVPTPVVVPAPEPEPEPEPVYLAPVAIRYSINGRKHPVNLDVLAQHFNEGDKIDLAALKEKGIVPESVKQVKILARSAYKLNKAFDIWAQAASENAKLYVKKAGGTITIVPPDEVPDSKPKKKRSSKK